MACGLPLDRIGIWLREKIGRNLVADGLENFQFRVRGQAGRRKLGALKITGNPRILAREKLPVHFLEIEGEIEGSADAWIAEFFAPNIKCEGLHRAAIADRKFFPHNALLAHGRKIVRCCPVLRTVFGAPVELIALETFKGNRGITKIFKPDLLKIPRADDDVDVLAPIVVDLFVDKRPAWRKFLEPVRPAAQRWLERRLGDVPLAPVFVSTFPPMLWQHRQLTDDLRQLAIAGTIESECDFPFTCLFDFGNVSDSTRHRTGCWLSDTSNE